MSGMSRQSSGPPSGGVPSWSIEIERRSAAIRNGTPAAISESSTEASGWPAITVGLWKVTLDGCSVQAASPNIAEPMSGGSVTSVGCGVWPAGRRTRASLPGR